MPNKIYTNHETTITWRDSGGTELMTLASLAAGAGRNGALHDRGAAPRATKYHWKFFCQFNTTPVVDEVVEIYLREGGVAAAVERPTNDDGTGDVALSSTNKLKNLKLLSALTVDEASTAAVMSVEGTFRSAARHLGPVIMNQAADALHATAANNGFDLTPIPDEVQ